MNVSEKLRITVRKPGEDGPKCVSDAVPIMGSAKMVEAQVTDRIEAAIRKARRLTETLDRVIPRGA